MKKMYFFLNADFRSKFGSLTNQLEVKFDKDKMFIFIETNNGDFAEYKVFIGYDLGKNSSNHPFFLDIS